ncbi:hypothetical protein [Chondrinema litorale]|uniref:hypothetical protein n=1 Tax=Chondrinema litorale TaxID=2994555 RepID=UPI002542B253|nr:hypothetical protein [Chondrinema litorale]UZS00267.1 hypothetical protein OQ292_40715 [Chondrinema litorale]
MSKVKGKLIKIWIDDDPVSQGGSGNKTLLGCQTDGNVSLETSEIEAVCKDDGNYSDALPDTNSATIDVSALVNYEADLNWAEICAIYAAQTICELTVSTDVVGEPEDVYVAFLTSAAKGFPVEGISQIDTSWKVKGAPTFGTVSA